MSGKNYIAIDDQDESVVNKKQYAEWRSFLFLFKFTEGLRGGIFLALCFLLIYSIMAMVSGHAMGVLVGDGLAKKNWDLTYKWSAIVLLAELLALSLHYFGRKILTKNASFVILKIRETLFKKLSSLPMQFFDRWPQGRVVTRMTHDVEGVEQFFTASLGRMLNAFFLAIAAAAAMLTNDWKLGLILISSMTPALLIVLLTRTKVNIINRKMSKLSSAINSKLSEYIDGLYVIRAFGLEKWSQKIFSKNVQDHVDITLEANLFYTWSRPLVSFLCGMPVVLLVWFGGLRLLDGAITLAVFVAFVRYTERFFGPVMMLFREIHVILQAFTSAQRVANFLREDSESDLFLNGDIFEGKEIHGEIEFKDVWMGYNADSWSLRGVSFKIQKGEKIGIVGTTGSGKTTTISILSRLYDFQKGDITIDGHSIKNWDLANLREQIGLVSQDVIIFQGTLRDNLTVNPNLSDDEILRVANITGLAQVMAKNGLKLDDEIKDGGANMSAGEKQVVSLTRTCLLNPHILILDEATAHVDPYYEKILHDGVENVMEGKTSFIIAHRLDTIKECDRILVFSDGKLVEVGSPDDLIENKGIFYGLSQAQEQL
jgi:ABC-type multidrug transport system fused ATPase/permease subunit